MSLTIVPVTFRQACAFIAAFHRHHRPPRGMKFALGVADSNQLVGVATVGRPVARQLDDGTTVEVTRYLHPGHAERELYALRRSVANRPRYGLPPDDHLHPARRDRCEPACGRTATDEATAGPIRMGYT